MIADQSDKDNWILSEFLDKLEQPTIPFYPMILGSKNGKIVELYKMTGDKVYEYLIPILKKQFFNENKRKDPRLGATIPKNFIINNSEKLL